MTQELIQSNPAFMMGKPVFRGTYITVESVLDKLADGESVEQILAAHTELTPDHIFAALKLAADVLRADVVYPISNDTMLASEASLRKDWLRAEEDAAWRNLSEVEISKWFLTP